MYFFVLWAVVGRIANFPFGAHGVAGVWLAQKSVYDRHYPCNITWGYVAWTDQGRGRGSNSRRGMGLQGVGLAV